MDLIWRDDENVPFHWTKYVTITGLCVVCHNVCVGTHTYDQTIELGR